MNTQPIQTVENELTKCREAYSRMCAQAESDIKNVALSIRVGVKMAIRDDMECLKVMISLVQSGERDPKYLSNMFARLESSLQDALS